MPEHKIVYRMRTIASPALRHDKHYTVRVKRGDSTQTFNPVRCSFGTVTGPQSWSGRTIVHFKLGGGGPNGYQPKILSIEILEKEKNTKAVGFTQVDVTRALTSGSQSGVIEGLACDFRMTGTGGATFGATVTLDIAVWPADQDQPAWTSAPPPEDEELEEGEKVDVTADAEALAAVEAELARVKQLLALRAQLKEAVSEAVTLATARRVSAYVNSTWATGQYEVDPVTVATGASENATRREAAKARLAVNKAAAQRSQALVEEAQTRVAQSRAALATLEAAYKHRHILGRRQEELEKAQAEREVADEFIQLLTDIAAADEAVTKAQADAGVIDAKSLKDRIEEEERIVADHKSTVTRLESVVADLEKTIALLATDPATLQEYNKARIAAIAASVTAAATAAPSKELLAAPKPAAEEVVTSSGTVKPVGLDDIFNANTAPAAAASPLATTTTTASPAKQQTVKPQQQYVDPMASTPAASQPVSLAPLAIASTSLPVAPPTGQTSLFDATPSSMCTTSRSAAPGALSSLDSTGRGNLNMPAAALQPPTMSTSTGRTGASASPWDTDSVFSAAGASSQTAVVQPVPMVAPLRQPQEDSSTSATLLSPDVQPVSSSATPSSNEAWVQQPMQAPRPAEPVPTGFAESVQSRSLDQSLSRTVTLQPALPARTTTTVAPPATTTTTTGLTPTTTPSLAALEPTAPPTADVSSVAPAAAFDPFSGGMNDFDNTAENELFGVNNRRAQAQRLLASTSTTSSSLGSTARQRAALLAADPFKSVEGEESLPRVRTTDAAEASPSALESTLSGAEKDDPLNATVQQLSVTARSTSAPAADFDPFAAVAESTAAATSRSASAFDAEALFAESPKKDTKPTTDLFAAAAQQQTQQQVVPDLTTAVTAEPPVTTAERSTSSMAHEKPLPATLNEDLFAEAPSCAPRMPTITSPPSPIPAIAAAVKTTVWQTNGPVDQSARDEALQRALQSIPTTMPEPLHEGGAAATSRSSTPALSRTTSQAALDSRGSSPVPAPRPVSVAAFDPFGATTAPTSVGAGFDTLDQDLFRGATRTQPATTAAAPAAASTADRTATAFTTLAPKPVVLDEEAKREAAKPAHDTEIFRALVGTAAQLQQLPSKPLPAPQPAATTFQQPTLTTTTTPPADDFFSGIAATTTTTQQATTLPQPKSCPATHASADEDFFRDFVGQKSLSSTVSHQQAQQSSSQTAFTWG